MLQGPELLYQGINGPGHLLHRSIPGRPLEPEREQLGNRLVELCGEQAQTVEHLASDGFRTAGGPQLGGDDLFRAGQGHLAVRRLGLLLSLDLDPPQFC